jgi:hypothetical protein
MKIDPQVRNVWRYMAISKFKHAPTPPAAYEFNPIFFHPEVDMLWSQSIASFWDEEVLK